MLLDARRILGEQVASGKYTRITVPGVLEVLTRLCRYRFEQPAQRWLQENCRADHCTLQAARHRDLPDDTSAKQGHKKDRSDDGQLRAAKQSDARRRRREQLGGRLRVLGLPAQAAHGERVLEEDAGALQEGRQRRLEVQDLRRQGRGRRARAAAAKTKAAAPSATTDTATCAACKENLPVSAFTKPQLKKGPAKQRCQPCIAKAEADEQASGKAKKEETLKAARARRQGREERRRRREAPGERGDALGARGGGGGGPPAAENRKRGRGRGRGRGTG